jgi:SAM-dependent methyltransferase
VGYALDVLADEFGCTTFGCDVVTPPTRITNFALFDGRRLPYRDGSVDVALLIFVLHHADDPSILLREASRVARRAVIVVEDTPENGLERRWGAMHVQSFSRRHRIPWLGSVRDDADWRLLFKSMGMPVLSAERLGRFERLPPVSRTTFVLAPAPQLAKVHKAERAATQAVTS